MVFACWSSAIGGALAALEEDSDVLRESALKTMYNVVDQFWAEMANAISLIEELSENDRFPGNRLAAAVASKIFFHLEEYDEALRLALGAGAYFEVNTRSEYVETLVSRCIDKFIAAPSNGAHCEGEPPTAKLDPRLEAIVESMFLRCYRDGEFEHAMGIALEARQLDKIKEVIIHCPNSRRAELMSYVAEVSYSFLKGSSFRFCVVRMLILMQETLDEPNYLFLCRAWQDLGETSEVSKMLLHLACGTEDNRLLSFQLAFNLVGSGSQRFIYDVLEAMNKQLSTATEEIMLDSGYSGGFATSMSPHKESTDKLRLILSIDGVSNEIQLKFLGSKCETDLLLLKNMKDAIDGSRSSILHNALVIAHSIMNAGTTNTAFLRENLDWMAKATNWAKFNATASIGVIHMGHIKKSLELLQPYLPAKPANARASSDSPYSDGGALYALGLIHANRGHDSKSIVVERLRHAIRHAGNSEPLQHGACLGVGLAAMGTGDPELYDEMKAVLFFDSAVAGEAAAFGIGLLLAGHGMRTQQSRSATSELLSYAHETSHEKIIRSIVISIALIVFGQENLAEPVIQQLCRDRDAIIRYGGSFAISLAYAGTANNSAVKRLLHVAVSDVSDDVRRAAVMCLGIVLYRTPHKVPTLVTLLSESFNPHVRYGACLAIGIACAGTGNTDSLLLLQPMLNDPVDFVRQGCLLALSLIFMLQTEYSSPSVKSFRGKIASIVGDKYPSILTKLGAIIAAGIVDAGGRNCSLSLSSSDGFVRSSACVGIALWLQHWYWYPMLHFFSLALAPSMLVGLNKDFQLPQSFSVYCAAPALRYAYPPKAKEKQETKRERVITAILSTTLKQQARERARGKEDGLVTQKHIISDQNTSRKHRQVELKKQIEVSDDGYHFLTNPTRIINTQQPHCAFILDGRYTPAAINMKAVGIIMLIDHSPTEVADTIDIDRISLITCKEADLPSPFSWPN
mmetsp:Transcript_5505/g.16241  ORF Transcript_5505/g.16241 Transcript_5505/m.16241 type:complete len:968 (+) Transcript_5505:141-3044(+)|eukprot:CAMPEP_0119260856 /NCGR_PEP_ID=MMETSP1329-20130426/1097_1 /TAXON_ID=114041 /ORGANISM="Genus nov. species nov., Strain RCC1024" /LENGTH=967 /DNA_ID=CAMNT_0007260325 /DNA_START=147 /DNA_END=3050 /DNA_ORIENTATION=-